MKIETIKKLAPVTASLAVAFISACSPGTKVSEPKPESKDPEIPRNIAESVPANSNATEALPSKEKLDLSIVTPEVRLAFIFETLMFSYNVSLLAERPPEEVKKQFDHFQLQFAKETKGWPEERKGALVARIIEIQDQYTK